MPGPTRRQFIKYGVGGATALTLLSRRVSSGQDLPLPLPPSPPTTPFVDPLPIPPITREVGAFPSPNWNRFIDPGQTHFFQLVTEQATVRFHRDLPPTTVWRYRDLSVPAEQYPEIALGPTFNTRMVPRPELGNLVRIFNRLPADHVGFGNPDQTTHMHGTHAPALSDGFPEDTTYQGQPFKVVYEPGEFFDYFYPNTDVGVGLALGPVQPDARERPSTLWYHDHLLDFTGPNVYRGLTGFHLVFDELDSGNERDPNPQALRLPSGPFDIPLLCQDKAFADDGSLVFNQFELDGFLGDKYVVNGKIQPYLRVKRRKYRFRVLDGANARFFQFFLTDSAGSSFPMIQIGRDSSLLSRSVPIKSFLIGPALRVEVVIDFGDPRFDGMSELFLENRLVQDEGRGPEGKLDDPELVANGVKLIKFVLEERVEDPSRVPEVLRPFEPIPDDLIAEANVRRFRYERSGGMWVINGELVDIDKPMVSPPLGAPELWHLINNSGGWWHPVHTHLEFGRVLRRNGMEPPLTERDGIAKVDTVVLGPNDTAEVFYRFRDYPGPFVNHCHNLEHEDHAMMFRYDVIGGVAIDTGLVAAYAFSEPDGVTARDVTGNGQNGTITGATSTSSGRYGNALTFDGLDDQVSVAGGPALELTTGLTIEAWVKPSQLSGWRTVIMKERPGGLAYALYAHDDAPRPAGYVCVGGVEQAITGTGALPLDTWTHLAITYDGALLSIYVNGSLANSRALSGSIAVSSSPLRLGGNTVWGEWLKGGIDEVRIYNRALSQADIQRDMNTPLETAAASPVSVAIAAPAAGASVSGTVRLEASASSTAGAIAGVRFAVDGTDLGVEATSAPYYASWNTAGVPNGPHRLTAVARDAAGNSAPSAEIEVTVANGVAAGLVAAYAFNEGAGTIAADASGNGRAGTISGATWVTGGRFGRALSFDGVNDWVTVADASGLDLTTAVTLEAWVKPTALSGWRTVVLKELTGAGLCYALYAHDNEPHPAGYIRTGSDEPQVPGTVQLPVGTWSHVALTYDGAQLRLYVNGLLAGSRNQAGLMAVSNGPLRIGGNSVWGEYFAGLIDEVRVYNRALSQTEINRDMNTAV